MSSSSPHPLDPLLPQEISQAARILKNHHAGHTLRFRAITLKEPHKAQLVPFLEAERAGERSASPPRIAMIWYYYDNDPNRFHEARVDLVSKDIVDDRALVGKQCFVDSKEMQAAERTVIDNPRVREAIKSMELPPTAEICVETWSYSPDGDNDMSQRYVMCYFYMRLVNHRDGNHYAYPLELAAELRAVDSAVINIYQLPSRPEENMVPLTGPAHKFDRRKIHKGNEYEYHSDLNEEQRQTLKRYQVIQPDGPSFISEGNLMTWEKWRFRVGFNFREGLVLNDVTYDGRSLFYRLSLAEMFVPYGDPRSPYPRKAAFDLGNVGAGVAANNLRLGCDCLGVIKYFDGWHNTPDGDPVRLPNAICCHETDDGILWKHTNHRTGNAVVTRSRVLVLQSIITIGNYEYIFAFHLNQAAEITYETRATGIVSTSPISIGEQVPFGTVVAPGVMAAYHQHLFSLRIDPALDGHKNSLLVGESVRMPMNRAEVNNPFGVGYTTTKSYVETEGPVDTDVTKDRTFKIVNESVRNPVSDTPVGYKISPHYSQMILADPSSYHSRRSEFAEHALWVTKYDDEEKYPSGVHMLQSLGGEGIASWIRDRPSPQSVRDEDIVIWHTFGATHNPRVEDWPVMPCEKMSVSLKPFNFFHKNPAMDVAISDAKTNASVLVEEARDAPCGGCATTVSKL